MPELTGRSGEASGELGAAGAFFGTAGSTYFPIPIAELAEQVRVLEEKGGVFRRANGVAKRLLDIVLAGIALIALGPFLVAVAILIRLDSPGPALFTQERWGRGLKKVRVFKFRSMYRDRCDISGVRQTEPGDARITRFGQFIRKTNIDELPQLLNVIRGDLSLVGPRCHPIGMYAGGLPFEELVPEYHHRHVVRPGITGWAQVNGYRGPTTDPRKAIGRIEHDLFYVVRSNVFFDIRIIILTIVREIGGGTGS